MFDENPSKCSCENEHKNWKRPKDYKLWWGGGKECWQSPWILPPILPCSMYNIRKRSPWHNRVVPLKVKLLLLHQPDLPLVQLHKLAPPQKGKPKWLSMNSSLIPLENVTYVCHVCAWIRGTPNKETCCQNDDHKIREDESNEDTMTRKSSASFPSRES